MSESLTIKAFQRYSRGRNYVNKQVIPALEKVGEKELSRKLMECGKFIKTAVCCSCDTYHWVGFNRCRSKWCVPCNSVKTKIWLSKLLPVIQQKIDDGFVCSHLSLTLKDFELGQLAEMIKALNHSWEIMTHGRGNREKWKEWIDGGVRNLEVKIGQNSGQWHAHLHVLLIHRPGRFFEWFRDEWEKASSIALGMKEKVGSVFIRSLKTKKEGLRGVIECVKYPIKPESQLFANGPAFSEAVESLHAIRQTTVFGCLRGLDKVVDSQNEIDVSQVTDFICQHCGCTEHHLETLLYDNILSSGRQLCDIEKNSIQK